MLKIRYYWLCFIVCLIQADIFSASKDRYKTPIKVENAKPLKKDQGYLLVKMDVEGVAPSLTVDRLRNKGGSFLDENESVRLLDEIFTIKLKDVGKGFYIMNLKAGLYQVTSVNVPYFNLPFRLDTSEEVTWRFSIHEGKTNYIGTLFVDKERSSQLVNVALFNRIATDKGTIETKFSGLLSQAALRNGTGVRDDFTQLLESANNE